MKADDLRKAMVYEYIELEKSSMWVQVEINARLIQVKELTEDRERITARKFELIKAMKGLDEYEKSTK